MSTIDTTLEVLGITDQNIKVHEVRHETRTRSGRKREYLVICADLSYGLTVCPHCQANGTLRPNGHKRTAIHVQSLVDRPVILELNKQRWLCSACHHTTIATTSLVGPRRSIANNIHKTVIKLAKDALPASKIADITGISDTSVARILMANIHPHAARHLPTELCFDEVRTTHGNMSFICIDARTHKLVKMLGGRLNRDIKAFFTSQYSLAERSQVHHIVMDMNASYQAIVHEVFPNAEVVFDRFHIVLMLGRALDRVRIDILKTLDPHSRVRKALKSQWHLFHKTKLDAIHRKYRLGLNEYLTEQEVVSLATNQFPELAAVYETYVAVHDALMDGMPTTLEMLLVDYHAAHRTGVLLMDVVMRTLYKNRRGVVLASQSPLSNGPIEGVNRKIKELKRSGYGYANQQRMFVRIYQLTA